MVVKGLLGQKISLSSRNYSPFCGHKNIKKKKKTSQKTLSHLSVPFCLSLLGSGTQLPFLFYLFPSYSALSIPWIMSWPFSGKHWPLGLCVVPSLASGTHHCIAVICDLVEQFPPSLVCWEEGGREGPTRDPHLRMSCLYSRLGPTDEGFHSSRWGQ